MSSQKKRSGYYDGPYLTSKKLVDLLPEAMRQIQVRYKVAPAAIVDVWPEIIGPAFAVYTKAVRFDEGVLYVHVKNSATMSLIANPADKGRVLEQYRVRFPQTVIKNIVFRIGA